MNDAKDYSKTKIYLIWSNSTEDVYIGYTIQTKENRFSQHKNTSKCMSREIIKFGDADIHVLEEYRECTCEDQAKARETWWMLQYPKCINKN